MPEARLTMTGALRIALVAAAAALAGCSDDTEQLRQQIAEIKARPGGRIEPLPEVKPYESFAYPDAGQRSPFEAGLPAAASMKSRAATPRRTLSGQRPGSFGSRLRSCSSSAWSFFIWQPPCRFPPLPQAESGCAGSRTA